MSKSIEISQIEESLEVDYEAFCNKCGKELHDTDKKTFANKLWEMGWRIHETPKTATLRCPDCVKKQN